MKYIGEKGQTGTQVFAGQIDNGDYLAAFQWPNTPDTVNRMRTDAIIAACETGFQLPIKQANYSISYQGDVTPDKQTILDDITNQFGRINMSDFLGQAFLAVPYGFYLFEPVYSLVAGKIKLDRLAPRMPDTVWKWFVDGSGYPTAIQQQVYKPQNGGESSTIEYPVIPIEKLLLITHGREGGNYTGRSEYRPIYREWDIKNRSIKQLAITIDRVGGGVPLVRVSADAPQSGNGIVGAVDQWSNAIKNLRGSESAGLVGQYADSVDMLFAPPEAVTKILDLIKYTDESIAKSMMQMYLHLGTSNTGSRALGATFESIYRESLYSIAEEITSAVNQQLIKRLVDWNYGPQDVYPKMSLSFETDMAPIFDVITKLKTAGIIAGNTDLENFALEWFGLPITTPENKLTINKTELKPIKDNNNSLTDIIMGGPGSGRKPYGKKINIENDMKKNSNELYKEIIGQEIVGYRYGKAPLNERSYNRMESSYENGVSLAKAGFNMEVSSMAVANLKEKGVKKYYYKGIVSDTGGDGEFLIKNIKEINKTEYNNELKNNSNIKNTSNKMAIYKYKLANELLESGYNLGPNKTPEKLKEKLKNEIQYSEINLSDNIIKIECLHKPRFNRALNDRENALWMADEADADLTALERAAAADFKRVIQPEMIAYAKKISEGEKPYKAVINWGNKVADLMRKYNKRLLDIAREDVKRSLVKQGVTASDIYQLADSPDEYLNRYNSEIADLISESIRTEATGDVLDYITAGKMKGLTGPALAKYVTDAILDEVGQRWDNMAGMVTGAYAMVREVAAEAFKELVTTKVRTAVMDRNTCEHCKDQDGNEYTKQADGTFTDSFGAEAPLLPDSNCEGMPYNNQCRCIYLYEVGK